MAQDNVDTQVNPQDYVLNARDLAEGEGPVGVMRFLVRQQAHRIFRLIRDFDNNNPDRESHYQFVQELQRELTTFTEYSDVVIIAVENAGTEATAASAATAATGVAVPLSVVPRQSVGSCAVLFVQLLDNVKVMYPSSVKRRHMELVNARCNICWREYNDHSTIHELENGNLVATIKRCKHTFHFDCLFQWVARERKCPLCRAPCCSE